MLSVITLMSVSIGSQNEFIYICKCCLAADFEAIVARAEQRSSFLEAPPFTVDELKAFIMEIISRWPRSTVYNVFSAQSLISSP